MWHTLCLLPTAVGIVFSRTAPFENLSSRARPLRPHERCDAAQLPCATNYLMTNRDEPGLAALPWRASGHGVEERSVECILNMSGQRPSRSNGPPQARETLCTRGHLSSLGAKGVLCGSRKEGRAVTDDGNTYEPADRKSRYSERRAADRADAPQYSTTCGSRWETRAGSPLLCPRAADQTRQRRLPCRCSRNHTKPAASRRSVRLGVSIRYVGARHVQV